MANDLSNPVNAAAVQASHDGFFDHGAGADSLFGTVQLAQADGPQPQPGQTIHVNPPQADAAGPVVIRVEVAPGSVVELPQPFDADAALAAKEGDGNLAIRVGDVTVILQGYIEAANDPQHPVTIEGADGKPIDIATILASTDPAIDIQTAAGPGDASQGGQGADNTGAILSQLEGGNGLGGFEGAGAQDQTELNYSLIDGSIRQEFASLTATTTDVFGITVGTIAGSFDEGFLRDPAQTSWLGDFANFMAEYQDAVENPGNPMYPGWADFQGTNATGGDFAEYLEQTRKTVTVDANFTGATGDLVLNGIAPNVTSNGSALYVEPADQGHTMFVRRDSDNALVAVIHVEGPDASGEFTIDTFLINRLDNPHADTGDAGKDPMTIEVDFTVYDGPAPNPEQEGESGPTSPAIEGSFSASFADDVPILEGVKYHNQHDTVVKAADARSEGGDSCGSDIGLIDEDWLKGGAKDKGADGSSNAGDNGDTGGGICVTGCIKVDFGADGPAQTDNKADEPANKHAFELNTEYKLGDTFLYQGAPLTSGHETLIVLSVSGDHLTVGIPFGQQQVQTLEGGGNNDETPSEPTDPIPGCTVFELTLNQATGTFEFDLKGPLDHTPQQSEETIFGAETGVSALTEETPTTNIEETISLQFDVKAYDDDGDWVDAKIDIDVNDDVPVARNDSDTVAPGSHDPLCGNVMTGWHTDSPSTGKDSEGGDGAGVTGVAAGALTSDQSGHVGTEIQGQFGKLTLNADGSYTYTRDAYSKGGVDDVFTYTLTDDDGDTSTATLTIHIQDSGVCITLPTGAGTAVDEAGLPARGTEPAGSDAASNSEQTDGTITITAHDGIKTLEIGGHELTLAELKDLGSNPLEISDSTGKLTLDSFDEGTGALHYTYVLTDNTDANSVNSVSFDIKVTDVDDDPKSATLTINIVDDEPTANCDTISVDAVKQPTADVQFILDISGSMEDLHVDVPGYPDNGVGLERYAIEQMLTSHPEIQNVQIVLFDEHATHSVWMTASDALAYVQDGDNFKNGGGNTNYDQALDESMDGFGDSRPLPQGDQTLVYFFSDGNPTQPGGQNTGINGVGNGSNVSTAEWEQFVTDNGISNVFTVGVGSISGSELNELNPISYPNTDSQPDGKEDNFLNISSSDVSTLTQSLDHVLVPAVTPITGDVTANDVSGADGFGNGKLVSVSYDGNTYDFDSATHQHTIDLGAGRGTLVINDDGTYTYTPPSGAADGTPFSVEYTIQDGDGDLSSAHLKIDLNAQPQTDLNGGDAGANNTASFIEQTPVQVAPAGTVSDDAAVSSMTVTLTNRPDGNGVESLSLNAAAQSAAAGLTVTYTASTGVLSITGAAPASVYQAILQGILYDNTSDTPNTATRNITVVVSDGSLSSTIHEIAVSVTPVNDAPVATIAPDSFNAVEQTDLTLSGKGLSISDVDSGNDTMTVTLSVGEGKLHINEGNSGADVISGNDSSTVTIKGSADEINHLLGGIDTGPGSAGSVTYNDGSDSPSPSTTLTLTVNDNGNNGTGGNQTAQDTATIYVQNTNDKPVTDLNDGKSGSDNSASFIEQTPVLVSPLGTVKDDSGTIASMTVTLTNRPDGSGTESLSLNAAAQLAAAGLTVTYTASTGVLSITGSASTATYQSILQGILYNNNSDTPNTTNRNITVVVSDGSLSSTIHSISVSVTPVNDAPVATITPDSFNAVEQTDLTLSGKGLSISDVDSGNDTMTVKLSVGEGKLHIEEGNSGVHISSGNDSSTVTITGSVAQINNLLGGIDTGPGMAGSVTYNNGSDTPSPSTTLTLWVDDNGNNGTGPDQTAQDTATIYVQNTNDKPVTDLNDGFSGSNNSASFTEQTPVLVSPLGTVADDSGTIASMTVTLTNRPDGNSAESLSLNAAALLAATGLTVTYTALTGVLSITGSASASTYEDILQGILYNNSSDTPNTTNRSITVVVNDGSLPSDSHSISVSVTPVNDAPVATITPLSFSATEQTSLILSGKGLSIGDVDSGNDTMTVKISVGEGVLNVSPGNSGIDSLSGSGTSTVTITGSVTEINNLLGGIDTGIGSAGVLEYIATSDTPGASTTLTLWVDDNGNNGTGPDQTAQDTATINITATNDAPIACDDSVYTNAGSSNFTIPEWALTYNDTDPDSPNSSLDVVNGASGVLNSSGGTASHPTDGVGNLGNVAFTDSGGNGGSFDYKLTDGSSTATGHVVVHQDTSNTLTASQYDDIVIVTGSGGTTVDAGAGNDIVIGGAGKDTLDGGSGNDLIFGQGGDDTMVFGSGDKYDGGTGFDRIEVDGDGVSITYDAGKFLGVEMMDIGEGNNRSGSSHENTLALNASDLGVNNFGSINGHQISLFVIGDTNGGNANQRDNVDLAGFNMTAISNGNFVDNATGQSHNYDVYQSIANPAIKVAVEHGLDVS